jgi:hypothetical protein
MTPARTRSFILRSLTRNNPGATAGDAEHAALNIVLPLVGDIDAQLGQGLVVIVVGEIDDELVVAEIGLCRRDRRAGAIDFRG